jgi:hypothetical protein
MTLSTSTGFDLPLEKTPGSPGFDKKTLARAARNTAGEGLTAEHRSEKATIGDKKLLALDATIAPNEGAGASDAAILDAEKIPLPPVPKLIVPRSREEICETLSKAAQNNDLPLPFFIRLLFQESRFRSGAVSPAGAQGIAQFMPATAAGEGLDNPFDPLQAIPASARLLRKLIGQFGNLGLAAAAYNAGPKRIQDWLEKKGALPEETQGYVKTITGRRADTWKVASADGTALTVPHQAPCKEAVQPMPMPAPRERTVTAAAAVGKPAATSQGNDAKRDRPSYKRNKATHVARNNAGKEKAAKSPPRQRHKAPTQQLAARKHSEPPSRARLAQK